MDQCPEPPIKCGAHMEWVPPYSFPFQKKKRRGPPVVQILTGILLGLSFPEEAQPNLKNFAFPGDFETTLRHF